MSLTKNKRIRCDWCGKLTSDDLGHYRKPDGSGNYGRIVQPEWERFPGGDETSVNQVQSDHDICEECAEDRCPGCGSDQVVKITPATPGPSGWGGRCTACGYRWEMPDPLHGEQSRGGGETC